MLVYALLPAMIFGLATGGRFSALSTQRLRLDWLLMPLLALAAVLPAVRLPVPDPVLVIGLWIMPVAVCVVVAGLNVREPGFPLVVVGLILNLVVVSVNLAMPVLIGNVAMIAAGGVGAIDGSWLHASAGDATRLLVLADVIPIPGPSGFRGMMSVGDLLVVIGVGEYVFLGMHAHARDDG